MTTQNLKEILYPNENGNKILNKIIFTGFDFKPNHFEDFVRSLHWA